MSLSPAEQLAYCTVRLECELKSGGVSTGTGFFFGFARDGEKFVPAIVTNKHVVSDAALGRFCLTLRGSTGEPLVGKTVNVQLDKFESRWTPHPDKDIDLCAMPIAPILREGESQGKQIFFITVELDLVPSDAELSALDLLEDVTMIGYPNGLWDRTHNMPVFRKGVLATHPALDWGGKPEFMIDAACFPGSSGSPVLLYNRGGFTDKNGNTSLGGTRVKLLGVLYAGPIQMVNGEISVVPVPTSAKPIASTAIPMNLGFVVKAKALHALDAIFRAGVKAG